jgi:hypothetical protein
MRVRAKREGKMKLWPNERNIRYCINENFELYWLLGARDSGELDPTATITVIQYPRCMHPLISFLIAPVGRPRRRNYNMIGFNVSSTFFRYSFSQASHSNQLELTTASPRLPA